MSNTIAPVVVDKFLRGALNDMEIENHVLAPELIEKLATEPGTPNWEGLQRIKDAVAAFPKYIMKWKLKAVK